MLTKEVSFSRLPLAELSSRTGRWLQNPAEAIGI